MTKEYLKKLCREHKLYGLPRLNDKLYLHYKGFTKIQDLEEYTGLRALWLEGNGLGKIEGLDTCKDLRTLFLHENAIDRMEGLENLENLDSINLSKNYIKKIENIKMNQKLTNVNLANNMLTDYASLEALLDVPGLQTVDVQHNKIDDANVVDLFAQFADLRVLYLQGNPVVKNIPYYRKTIISKCKVLKYLDDRPVFEDERRRVNAWATAFEEGGLEAANTAERDEIKQIRREKDETDARNMAAFEKMMRDGLEIKRQRELTATENDNGDFNSSILLSAIEKGEQNDTNPFSGEKIVNVPENSALKQIREERESRLYNQENLDMNHLMPPPPPPTEVTVAASKHGGFDNLPPIPPAVGSEEGVWNKLQIESDGADEDRDDADEEGKNNIESVDTKEKVHGPAVQLVSTIDLESLD